MNKLCCVLGTRLLCEACGAVWCDPCCITDDGDSPEVKAHFLEIPKANHRVCAVTKLTLRPRVEYSPSLTIWSSAQ